MDEEWTRHVDRQQESLLCTNGTEDEQEQELEARSRSKKQVASGVEDKDPWRDRGQRTEDRGQRTEDRGQRTEDREQRQRLKFLSVRTERTGANGGLQGHAGPNRALASGLGEG